MDTETIKERIRKLLRLAGSPNQMEAQAALAKALSLANDYCLSIEDISPEDDPIIEHVFRCGLRVTQEAKMAAGVVQTYFGCFVLLRRPHIHFFGAAHNCEIAEYVFHYLIHAVRSAKKAHFAGKRQPATSTIKSYIAGFFYGVVSNLEHEESKLLADQGDHSLALRRRGDDAEAFGRERYGSSIVPWREKKYKIDGSSTVAGYYSGRKVTINPALAGASLGSLTLCGNQPPNH